jgi:hypothetical protein
LTGHLNIPSHPYRTLSHVPGSRTSSLSLT